MTRWHANLQLSGGIGFYRCLDRHAVAERAFPTPFMCACCQDPSQNPMVKWLQEKVLQKTLMFAQLKIV